MPTSSEQIIFLTRHGQTAYNKGIRNGKLVDGTPIVQTFSDIPETQLLPAAYDEQRQKGRILRRHAPSIIYHTDLGRTRSTAELIMEELETPRELRENKSFRDQNFAPHWEGKSLAEIENSFEKEFRDWKRAEERGDFAFKLPHTDLTLPEPESIEEVILRVGQGLEEIIAEQKTTLIVSHGHSTKAMIFYLLQNTVFEFPQTEFKNIQTPNSCLYKVRINSRETYAFNYEKKKWIKTFY